MNARWIALTLVASAAIASCAAAAGADSGAPAPRVVVVADASVPRGQALAAVRAAGAGAELRTPRTATEQLSVTHWFAARGYDVVGVGLDEALAVRPVLRRYPGVRFMLASPR
jgi:hypothetical protein